MVNYNNGKIYKIEPIVDHDEGDIYIGSTTKQYLSQRMDTHRNDYKRKHGSMTCFKLFDKYGFENCCITLLETVQANSKDELHARERFYIQSMKCVNKVIPLQTPKEYREIHKDKMKVYYETNKDKIKELTKEYYETNKDKITEYSKEYYENHKDKIHEYKKDYYESNKDKIKEQRKQYYNTNKENVNKYNETNKEKIKKRYQTVINCACGSKFCCYSKNRHERTTKHQTYLKTLLS
jgi:hypothetical protein